MAIDINIGSKLDGKGFKQADTAINKLNKSTKSLTRNLGLALGTAAIISFGKASVKAFAEDDKAAKALGQTLKNLNLAYGSNAATVNGFISRLELQTGVLDDELRPAMDRLLRATGDVTKSQELLGLALDISAGTGKSVTQVSQSLQKAYLGQNQALGRLGVGLTKAELESSSFEEIQARLAVLFAGQATSAANTYAGSLAKLTIAGNNAKETIGKGLVDAFVTITNSSSVDDLIGKIDTAAESIANFVRETGKFIQITKNIFKNPSFFAPSGGLFGDGKGFGNIQLTGGSNQDTQRADLAARKKAEAEARRRAAELLKAQNALLKAQKDQIKLAKARAIFDLQKIQIEAALKGKLSEEDRARLLLMKAIENENISDIEKYTKMLTEAQAKAKELQSILDKVKNTSFASLEDTFPEDLFKSFRESAAKAGTSVEAIIAKVQLLTGVILSNQIAMTSFAQGINAGVSIPEALSGARYAAQGAAKEGLGTMPTPPPSNEPIGALPETGSPTRRGGGVGGVTPLSINVNVGGSIISEGGLIDAITNAIYQQQKNGKAIVYNSTSI